MKKILSLSLILFLMSLSFSAELVISDFTTEKSAIVEEFYSTLLAKLKDSDIETEIMKGSLASIIEVCKQRNDVKAILSIDIVNSENEIISISTELYANDSKTTKISAIKYKDTIKNIIPVIVKDVGDMLIDLTINKDTEKSNKEDNQTSNKNKKKIKFKPIPLVSGSSDDGFGYGLRVTLFGEWANRKPYAFKAYIEYFATTKWIINPSIYLDVPEIAGSDFRITAKIKAPQIEKGIPYYGIGNNTAYDSDGDDYNNILEQQVFNTDPYNSNDTPTIENYTGGYNYYYKYKRIKPEGYVNLQKKIIEWKNKKNGNLARLNGVVGIGLVSQFVDIYHTVLFSSTTPVKPSESLLIQDTAPENIVLLSAKEWSLAPFVKLGVSIDARDDEDQPEKGYYTELVVDYFPYIIYTKHNAFSSYVKITFVDQRFWAPFKKLANYEMQLVFAEQVNIELMFGKNIPFYQLGQVASLHSVEEGLGGSGSLRGILKYRYMDQNKIFANFEIRWRSPYFIPFAGDPLALGIVAFLDIGRVWGGLANGRWASSWASFVNWTPNSSETPILGFHGSIGIGARIFWGPRFIINADVGWSLVNDGGMGFYIGFGHMF